MQADWHIARRIHSHDQRAARIRAESLNYSRQGQLALRDKNFKPTIEVVNIPPPPAPPAPKDK